MSIHWTTLFFVAVNWLMLLVIFLAMGLLIRFLWRAGGKKRGNTKALSLESANSEAEPGVGLGEALRRRRQDSGMTQELVAEQLGVSRQAVSRWEKGEARPSSANIQALAGLYGITPAELLREGQNC